MAIAYPLVSLVRGCEDAPVLSLVLLSITAALSKVVVRWESMELLSCYLAAALAGAGLELPG